MATFDPWIAVIYGASALIWLALAWALGTYGSGKGYSFWLCFMLGLAASPLVAWIIVALLPEREQKYKAPLGLMLAIEQEKARMKAEQASAAQPGTGG